MLNIFSTTKRSAFAMPKDNPNERLSKLIKKL
ncbi:DNA-binding protein, partial [Klebsiella pneumoniae]|nr:DNA-binding protein [Klebsiella pneumoniae]